MWSDRSDRSVGRMPLTIDDENARCHLGSCEDGIGSIVSRESSGVSVDRWAEREEITPTREETSRTNHQQSNEPCWSFQGLSSLFEIELYQTHSLHVSLPTVGYAQWTRLGPLFAYTCSWRNRTTNDRWTSSSVSVAEEWIVDDLSDSSDLRSTERIDPQSTEFLATRFHEQRWWIVCYLGKVLLGDQRILWFSRTTTNEDRRRRTSEDRVEVTNWTTFLLLPSRCSSSVTFRQLLGSIVKQLRKDVSFHRCESLIKEVIEEFCSSFQTTLSLIDCSTPIRVSPSTRRGKRSHWNCV